MILYYMLIKFMNFLLYYSKLTQVFDDMLKSLKMCTFETDLIMYTYA